MDYQILKIKLEQIIECIDYYTGEPSAMILLKKGKEALEYNDIEVINFVIRELILWYQKNLDEIKENEYVTNFDVHLRNTNILQEILDALDNNKVAVPELISSKNKNSLNELIYLLDRFHLVTKQLRVRHNSRETLDVTDEYDVQDLLHSLLYIYFDDVRAEEWTPSYAGKCARQDFLIKNENIVIEVKKTRKGLTSKELGDELVIDIARYKTHPNCKTLVCFVYDPEERIVNPVGIANDLTTDSEELNVIVKIIQK